MDSKGRSTAADIPERMILEAVEDFRLGKSQLTPERQLAQFPVKVVMQRMSRLADRDMIEYGVSLRTAWLTDKGAFILAGYREGDRIKEAARGKAARPV